MSKGRLILDLDFDTGAYTVEVKNLDEPGSGIALAPLRAAFEQALKNIEQQAGAAKGAAKGAARSRPAPMEVEDSVTSGRIRISP